MTSGRGVFCGRPTMQNLTSIRWDGNTDPLNQIKNQHSLKGLKNDQIYKFKINGEQLVKTMRKSVMAGERINVDI